MCVVSGNVNNKQNIFTMITNYLQTFSYLKHDIIILRLRGKITTMNIFKYVTVKNIKINKQPKINKEIGIDRFYIFFLSTPI